MLVLVSIMAGLVISVIASIVLAIPFGVLSMLSRGALVRPLLVGHGAASASAALFATRWALSVWWELEIPNLAITLGIFAALAIAPAASRGEDKEEKGFGVAWTLGYLIACAAWWATGWSMGMA